MLVEVAPLKKRFDSCLCSGCYHNCNDENKRSAKPRYYYQLNPESKRTQTHCVLCHALDSATCECSSFTWGPPNWLNEIKRNVFDRVFSHEHDGNQAVVSISSSPHKDICYKHYKQ